jgi:DNA-directed RNA polymerase I, II, and III subunit RPABC2
MSDYGDSGSEYDDASSVISEEEIGEINTKKPLTSKNGLATSLTIVGNDDDSDGSLSDEEDNENLSNFGDESDLEIDGFSDTEYDDGHGHEEMEEEQEMKEQPQGVSGGAKGKKKKVSLDGNELEGQPVILGVNQTINGEEDEDEEDDVNYMQKFDREIRDNYLTKYHPECEIHNYDEVDKMTVIVRDENNNVIDPLHKTVPYLTKYERTRILGQRAKQIECGAKPFVTVPDTIIDSYVIAEMELKQKKIPFIIRRPLPNGVSEYWNVKDLEIL